ncbi:MAG: 1-acyl-sn-glycerol-3-phosphate acyltransferase [Anaerolineales bacterium]|nr:1-acyl-sn-glycerol-3-phosphate acyltransferase [Anaerolineales bacterium]
MFSYLLRWAVYALFKLLSRFHVEGKENIPKQGPAIVVLNHMSYVDSVMLFSLIGSPKVSAWVAADYRKNLFFGLIARMGRAVFIRRGEVDREALDMAIEHLNNGGIFGVAPEGTRSKTGSLQRAKTGAAFLASQSGAPLIPVAVSGTENFFQDLKHFKRPLVTFRFGPAFTLPSPDSTQQQNLRQRTRLLREQTDEIMCHIAGMLPEHYHGYYTDHPLLKP